MANSPQFTAEINFEVGKFRAPNICFFTDYKHLIIFTSLSIIPKQIIIIRFTCTISGTVGNYTGHSYSKINCHISLQVLNPEDRAQYPQYKQITIRCQVHIWNITRPRIVPALE